MKRMELFHCEYQHEEQQYLQQKEREEKRNGALPGYLPQTSKEYGPKE